MIISDWPVVGLIAVSPAKSASSNIDSSGILKSCLTCLFTPAGSSVGYTWMDISISSIHSFSASNSIATLKVLVYSCLNEWLTTHTCTFNFLFYASCLFINNWKNYNAINQLRLCIFRWQCHSWSLRLKQRKLSSQRYDVPTQLKSDVLVSSTMFKK